MDNTICLNDILDGISIKLNTLFGDDYTIYTNEVEQGFKTPCFYIKALPESRSKKVGNRYYVQTSFVIHTFLKSPTVEELNNIANELYELEYIELINKDLLRGKNMRAEIVDDVLEFFIDYNFYAFKQVQKVDNMTEISINGEVKNG